MSAHCLVLSCLYIVTRTRTVAQVISLSHHPHVHVHVSVSPRLALPFYFPHFLPHSFHFLLHLKFVDYNLLRIPHKEGVDLSDEFLLTTNSVRVNPHKLRKRKKYHGMIDDLDNVDFITSNVNSSRQDQERTKD